MALRQTIRDFIVNNYMYGAAPEDLRDSLSLLESGIMDSTGVMELILFLEQQFRIKVEDAEMLPENLDSVDNICGYLERKRSQAGLAERSAE